MKPPLAQAFHLKHKETNLRADIKNSLMSFSLIHKHLNTPHTHHLASFLLPLYSSHGGFCRACQSAKSISLTEFIFSEWIQVSGFQIQEQMSDQCSQELSYAKNHEMLAVNQCLSHVRSCPLWWHHLRESCMHTLGYVWHSAHTRIPM